MAEVENLKRGAMLPSLKLPEAGGKEVRSEDYRGRCNLVLFLTHGAGCERCIAMLEELAAGYGGLVAAEAEVMALVPASAAETAELKRRLALPFPLLADADGSVLGRLGGGGTLLVVDRFGEIFVVAPAAEGHQMMSVLEIADWIDFIEVQCPECGAPDWPIPNP